MKKKKMSLLALLFVMAFAVCGCTEHAGREEKTDSGVEDRSRDRAAEDQGQGGEVSEYVKPEMQGEITVSCFIEPDFLEIAAKQFMDKYPDVTVTVNDYAEHLDEPSTQDYQTAFNTKLMSGDAEDIIFNFCLPVVKYSEMGAFEDLSTYIGQTPEMNDENYYMNVLKAAQNEDGNIYMIPSQAAIETVGFSSELLKEHGEIENTLKGKENICFSEMMDLAEQLAEGKSPSENVFLANMDPAEAVEYWIKDSLSDFMDQEKKEVRLDTPEYIDLLNSVKKIGDEGWFDYQDVNFYNTEYDFAAYKDTLDVQAAAFAVDPQSGQSYTMPLADKQGKLAIMTHNSIALNHSSEHKELAWEFIKYLLSDEIQSLPSVYGLSVNRQGFEKSVERHYDEGVSGSLEDYRNLLVSWMEQVNACDTRDDSIVALMRSEHEKFFDGQQSAEETAKTLQKQIEQYFHE
ncbi:MAG: ABC transporter substrate-binding protein [Clostridium sp.]|nr:ABC transporter substrate-binding protein [Clostridium sp.]